MARLKDLQATESRKYTLHGKSAIQLEVKDSSAMLPGMLVFFS